MACNQIIQRMLAENRIRSRYGSWPYKKNGKTHANQQCQAKTAGHDLSARHHQPQNQRHREKLGKIKKCRSGLKGDQTVNGSYRHLKDGESMRLPNKKITKPEHGGDDAAT